MNSLTMFTVTNLIERVGAMSLIEMVSLMQIKNFYAKGVYFP